MSKFYIVTIDGQEKSATEAEFKTAYNSDDYFLYKQGGIYVLLHKGNERAAAAYDAHHKDTANEWGKKDRLSRCLDENSNICKKDCRLCDRERENRAPVSLDERLSDYGLDVVDDSINVEKAVISDAFISEMRSVLYLLEDAERCVIEAIYGVNKEPVSLSEYAETEGLKYSTARSHRDRAMRKLPKLSAHLKDYLD